jgi:hypothetical protein
VAATSCGPSAGGHGDGEGATGAAEHVHVIGGHGDEHSVRVVGDQVDQL